MQRAGQPASESVPLHSFCSYELSSAGSCMHLCRRPYMSGVKLCVDISIESMQPCSTTVANVDRQLLQRPADPKADLGFDAGFSRPGKRSAPHVALRLGLDVADQARGLLDRRRRRLGGAAG